jgi:hypothetical protein
LNNDNENNEKKFYGLYNMILNHMFPPAENYIINPQWTVPNSRKTIDYTITALIEQEDEVRECPLLLVEIKAPSHIHSRSRRSNAIVQLMEHLDDVGPGNQHTDWLYAISAIGKQWRAYYAFCGRTSAGGQAVRGITEGRSLRGHSPEF